MTVVDVVLGVVLGLYAKQGIDFLISSLPAICSWAMKISYRRYVLRRNFKRVYKGEL